MIYEDREKFRKLCLEDRIMRGSDADGIGTYNEKRLHRIIKRYVTENAECYEVKIGKNIADVFFDGEITEIQTSSFRPLGNKIAGYLESTGCAVTVICPLIAEKTVIKADKQTGEIFSAKKSPKHERVTDIFPRMFYLKEYADNPRLNIVLLYVSAEEYRYSERVRYRKTGAYDNDLRPVELIGSTVLCGIEDYKKIMSEILDGKEATTEELAKLLRLKGRKLSLAVSFLLHIGAIKRRKYGKRYIYY